jgi:RHS repeat-associated protein
VGNKITYTGRFLEKETFLHYFRKRFYDAGNGIFINRDPLVYIDGFNYYQNYFTLNYTDPFGQGKRKAVLIIIKKNGKMLKTMRKDFEAAIKWIKNKIKSEKDCKEIFVKTKGKTDPRELAEKTSPVGKAQVHEKHKPKYEDHAHPVRGKHPQSGKPDTDNTPHISGVMGPAAAMGLDDESENSEENSEGSEEECCCLEILVELINPIEASDEIKGWYDDLQYFREVSEMAERLNREFMDRIGSCDKASGSSSDSDFKKNPEYEKWKDVQNALRRAGVVGD